MGLQPRYNTVADIMKAYSEGIGKAVAQRKMAKNLTNARVNGRNTKTGEQLNFMYFGKKPKDFEFEYIDIKHDSLIHMVPSNKKQMNKITRNN